MKYPKTLRIGGHKISVKIVDTYTVDGHATYTGESSLSDGRIKIAIRRPTGEKQTLRFTNDTFYHEILHLISDVYNVKLEEDQVIRLSQGLLQVLEQLKIRLIEEE